MSETSAPLLILIITLQQGSPRAFPPHAKPPPAPVLLAFGQPHSSTAPWKGPFCCSPGSTSKQGSCPSAHSCRASPTLQVRLISAKLPLTPPLPPSLPMLALHPLILAAGGGKARGYLSSNRDGEGKQGCSDAALALEIQHVRKVRVYKRPWDMLSCTPKSCSDNFKHPYSYPAWPWVSPYLFPSLLYPLLQKITPRYPTNRELSVFP